LPSTIDALIAVAVNHCRQPLAHSTPSPSTIGALIALLSTINTLIAVAVNHQRTHCPCRQPSTHSSPLPSTINALIAVTVNLQ